MKIKSLNVQQFRNLTNICFEPSENVNVIYGDNAQGKTNLLEAIWIFSGMKSFRGAKDVEFIPSGEDFTKLSLEFFSSQRDYKTDILITDAKKKVLLNEVDIRSQSELSEYFSIVAFAPEHNMIVKGGPTYRRNFLDQAISQLFPKYSSVFSEYKRALQHRNVIIKDIGFSADLIDTLVAYDRTVAKLGTVITRYRHEYLKKIIPHVKEIYSSMTGGKENLDLYYESTIYTSDFLSQNIDDMNVLFQKYIDMLEQNRQNDIRGKVTTCGIHRDDILLSIDGKDSRIYGSQGQQRSCVLALKLAQTRIITEQIGEPPVILLDDVMSELDINRQSYLLNKIDGYQIFITCCDPSSVKAFKIGKLLEIKDGRIK